MSVLRFCEADDCWGCILSCEDVLEIEEGAMHGSCVKEDGCDSRVRVGV